MYSVAVVVPSCRGAVNLNLILIQMIEQGKFTREDDDPDDDP